MIVCADADVDAAVKAVIIGRYWNAGQACLGCKRVFVHDSVYDEFVSQLVERVGRYEPGDGTVKAEKPKLRMGPIHTRAGRDELLEQIEDGVSSGGELLIGGGTGDRRQGLLPRAGGGRRARRRLAADDRGGVRPGAAGVPLQRLRRRDRARQRHPVRPGLLDLDPRRAAHPPRGQEIDAGMTWVNQIHYGYDELPFGGVKASGFGKEHGIEALDSYVEIKSVVVGGLA